MATYAFSNYDMTYCQAMVNQDKIIHMSIYYADTLHDDYEDKMDTVYDIKFFPVNGDYAMMWVWNKCGDTKTERHIVIPCDKIVHAYKAFIAPIETGELLKYEEIVIDHDLDARFADDIEVVNEMKKMNMSKYTYDTYGANIELSMYD